MTSYSPPQVADMLGVAPETVIAWVRSGQLPGFDVSRPAARRPRFRITDAALAKFIEQRQTSPKPISSRQKRVRRATSPRKDYFADVRVLK
ncbi:MAG: helix-turn-helix domain-containing protein [Planctomycetaceae bacterium]|uniref:helix-turn-helix domain-containing protein n=1 Tax=Lacipirellula limnantheis TaxID=2528024 RepID=UPI00143D9B32|nr:helix-turn-helix domain-containing protein [Planctomycetaceae bacterium]